MYAAQTPAPRDSSGNVATIVLAAVHTGLVLITLLFAAGLFFTYEADSHDRCRIHGLNCGAGARISEAVWIGLLGSAVLIILDLVLTTRLQSKRRRLSVLVPLLCCIGQLIVVGIVLSLGAGTV